MVISLISDFWDLNQFYFEKLEMQVHCLSEKSPALLLLYFIADELSSTIEAKEPIHDLDSSNKDVPGEDIRTDVSSGK